MEKTFGPAEPTLWLSVAVVTIEKSFGSEKGDPFTVSLVGSRSGDFPHIKQPTVRRFSTFESRCSN